MTERKKAQLNEPWTVRDWKCPDPIGIVDCYGNVVFNAKYGGNWEDFDRIVACVNACKDLTTEWLESHAIVYDEAAGIIDIPNSS